MPIFYCPDCGNVTVYGEFKLLSMAARLAVKDLIAAGKISDQEQGSCYFCVLRKQIGKVEPTPAGDIVNYCLNCFDLEDGGIWRRLNFSSRELFKKLITDGFLRLNGAGVDKCPSCIDIEKFVTERKRHLYNDSYETRESFDRLRTAIKKART